tara:strand:+ start:1259 stop:1948 length:690 start_codon:yes stop_codon:yes gene_type:complete
MNNNDLNIISSIANSYDPSNIIINLITSLILGLLISYVYRLTHKGISYSQSFMLTIVFVSIIVAMVMMVIGNNIARAFALVGALSIIRFRTVIKDTKDTAYIFIALAAGMAAGTSNYYLAVIGVVFFIVVAIILYRFNYGSIYKSQFILRFTLQNSDNEQVNHIEILQKYCQKTTLLQVEPSEELNANNLTFDLVIKKDIDPINLTDALKKINLISNVVVVASEFDVDY